MKHRALCIECQEADPEPNVWAIGDVESELVAVCRCPKGHVVVARLMHDNFDALYSSAIYAYLGSFFSESIVSFAAALERAHEKYVKLFLLRSGVSLSTVDEYWRELRNQSERQYGAFCSAYVATERVPWCADQKQISFRNNVIHKGYIATRGESESYAEYVTSRLNLIMKSIKSRFSEQMNPLYFHEKESTRTAVNKIIAENENAKVALSGNPSFLKWNFGDHEDATLAEAIETAKKMLRL